MPKSECREGNQTANIQIVDQSGTVLLKFDIPNALITRSEKKSVGQEENKYFLFESQKTNPENP